ncbi:MAG: HEAT repeat domain-containing protein [Myxococcales bacterium]|nr:HEAT repeat domain-containing protein [Myxococcales bacterium]
MSFWKKVVRFFAEASTPAEATRTLADRAKSEDARRAQIEIVESLSDRLPSSEPNAAVTARGIFHDLTIALADPEPWVRATAARGLREISGVFRYEVGDDVIQKALAALLLSAEDPDPTARARVASALSGLCDVAADADKARIATAIRPLCDDPSPELRAEGAIDLGSCGEAASAFVPRLGELLADPDERVRGNAASALWMVGVPVDHAHVTKLSALLAADPSGRVRADAANALGKLGRDASDAVVPLLVRATADTIHDVRHFAVFALSDFGPLAAPAVPRLGELLAQEEHREAAAIALRSVASAAAHAELARHHLPLE